MRHLVLLAGPIGAGKSTIADLLARRLAEHGLSAALADLDDLAFSQRGTLDLGPFWRRAGIAHSALVRGWFDAGTDVVVAHGPFFESRSHDTLVSAAPKDARVLHVLLRVSFTVALARVTGDPDRGPGALSRDPDFLRSTHDRFGEVEPTLPRPDLEVDTSEVSAAEVADRVARRLVTGDTGSPR